MSGLPGDLTVRQVGSGELVEMMALVERCIRTYAGWASPSWKLPGAAVDVDRWRQGWHRPRRWARGAYDRAGALVALASWAQEVDAAERPIAGIAHVSAVFVDPERWREGIGEAMLALAEAAMAGAGYRLARLWTPDGAPAQRFYEEAGWLPDGRRSWHPFVGLPIVGYQKRLR
jgi:GNAT superfamily N-acetyltransferase